MYGRMMAVTERSSALDELRARMVAFPVVRFLAGFACEHQVWLTRLFTFCVPSNLIDS